MRSKEAILQAILPPFKGSIIWPLVQALHGDLSCSPRFSSYCLLKHGTKYASVCHAAVHIAMAKKKKKVNDPAQNVPRSIKPACYGIGLTNNPTAVGG